MSLEERMASLEAAIKELTAVVGGKANSGEKSEGRSRSSEKDAEPPKEDGRRRRSSESKDDKKDDKKSDKVTIDELRKAYGEWLGDDDSKGFDDRREFLEAVLDELGVDMIKDTKDADIPAVMHWLKLYKKNPGEKVNFDDRGDGDDKGGSRRSSARDRV